MDRDPIGCVESQRYSLPLAIGTQTPMNNNTLYLVIGALFVVVVGLGAYIYNEQTKPSGVEIKLDQSGVSIEEN